MNNNRITNPNNNIVRDCKSRTTKEYKSCTTENLKEAHLESRGILFEGTKEVNPNKKGKQVIKELEKNE